MTEKTPDGWDEKTPDGWTDEELTELGNDEPLEEVLETTINDVLIKLAEVEAKFDAVIGQVQALIASVEPYVKDIAPVIDAIANHPMLSMFLGTKKGKK